MSSRTFERVAGLSAGRSRIHGADLEVLELPRALRAGGPAARRVRKAAAACSDTAAFNPKKILKAIIASEES